MPGAGDLDCSPGTAPQPRADVQLNAYHPLVYKFDEHYFGRDMGLYYWQDSHEELLEAFALALQKHPKSTGYLVAYRDAGRETGAWFKLRSETSGPS